MIFITSLSATPMVCHLPRRQQATALLRRRLLSIVRNSFWLSLTHYATPPFPQKSRSACLFGCKRPHDGSLSLPTFAVCGQGRALSLHCSKQIKLCVALLLYFFQDFCNYIYFLTSSAKRRSALPLWLTLSFSSGVYSANALPSM